ncbi:MAG: LLM class flavin-dependent oxidoreductase [Pseudomonadota bacterium]|jgi:probable F420-dependent oxidoreductase|nr:hypothetical protein [Alphaproteobacteria bacterium]
MTYGVGLGIANFPFRDAEAFWRWVDLCEDSGVDSIWQSDRIVSKDPHLECMSVMAALAGATRRLKFGMNVASAGLRDPLLLAKQCATIDVLSNGRLLPAFGVGSAFGPEWAATGRPTRRRGVRTDECLLLISRLWREESVSFEGEFFQYKDVSISPRPVQSDIPLWVGGSAEGAIRRTALYGTGWQAGIETPAQIAPVIEGVKQALLESGRTIDADHYGAGFAFRFGRWDDAPVARNLEALSKRVKDDPRGYYAVGGAEDILARLREFIAAGAHKFILRPVAANGDEMLAQTKLLIDEVLPEIDAMNG